MREAHMPKAQDDYQSALVECERARTFWSRVKGAISAGRRAEREDIERLLDILPRGLYRHFKGGLYVIEAVIYDVNGVFDPVVDYAALYGELTGLPAGRTLYGTDGVLAPIDREGHRGKRFTLIRKLTILQSAKLRSNARQIARAPTAEAAMRRINLALRP